MMRYLLGFLVLWIVCLRGKTQIDPDLLKIPGSDSSKQLLNMDAVYNRPFTSAGKLPVSLGGYLEANWQHLGTDGISEGHQFQFRRMTLFVSSTITRRLKFLSELEFEDGTKEIALEFAALDLEFHPLLNLRGGVILNPIGAFNQNHDGPKWEFVDRPVSATQLLPATWSNAGFGLYGKYNQKDWMFGYEAYFSGNFDQSIIDNSLNRTSLAEAKKNANRFEEIHSGLPLFTGKAAVRHNHLGELGLSYMGGVYNKYQEDGLRLDKKRRVDVFAIDFNGTLPWLNTFITGEWSWIRVNVPPTYTEQYGNKQHGGFVDLVQPILKQRVLDWDDAVINLAVRLEYVDWNRNKFVSTGEAISDHLWSLVPALSFRPSGQTVIRLNYRFQRQRDLLGNPPARTGGFSFGFSSYF